MEKEDDSIKSDLQQQCKMYKENSKSLCQDKIFYQPIEGLFRIKNSKNP